MECGGEMKKGETTCVEERVVGGAHLRPAVGPMCPRGRREMATRSHWCSSELVMKILTISLDRFCKEDAVSPVVELRMGPWLS